MEITPELQKKITGILLVLFPTAKIYLFGSRARGTHRPVSDIDIALDTGEKISFRDLGEASSLMEALHVPLRIDVVDIHSVPITMREAIIKERVIWKE